MEKQRVEVPYAPRMWARKLHASLARWAALVLHRRAGKTTAILNHHQRAAMDDAWEMARLRHLLPDAPESHLLPLLKRRVYWHVMPTLKQAKLVAWDMLKEFSAPIPGVHTNNSDLEITYPNGNKLRLLGADDPDSLRGPALNGLSLDEYSQIDPRVFGEVLSKALGDHVGYCIFSGTIKGKDQLYTTYQAAKGDYEWYSVWQDIDESLATESGPTITALARAMADDRKLVLKGVMKQAEFDQEWYLSVDASIHGAFFADEMKAARESGRITRVPHDPAMPVDTDWDLGIDAMAVWFSQSERSGSVRLISYHEDVGGGLPAVIKYAQEKATAGRWMWGKHWAPHDIEVREISSGLTRKQSAASLGISFDVTPKIALADGITAAQLILARCWFDEDASAHGLEALRHYRRKFNKRLGVFTADPEHDVYSHGADAFRGLAVRHQIPREAKKQAAEQFSPGWQWT